MQQSKMVETWVGLFVALGMAGLFFLSMKVSNLGDLQSKDNSFKITARFENAGSLRERAAVSMAGVRVGRVSAIRFDKATYEAVVEMRIDPEYDTIPTDTTASVLTAGLLGEQYVGLSAGGADEFLKDGDEIELTQSALVLEEVISRFLFNKAEGGSEKKDAAPAAAAPEEDAEPAKAAIETPPPPAAPAKAEEEPAAAPAARHARKPKRAEAEEEEQEAAPARKPKAAHGGKSEEEPHAERKPKSGAHPKTADHDQPDPRKPAAKPPAKGPAP